MANMDDSGDEACHKPACIRCHAHKVRCTRPANKKRCKRCYRANVECIPRPSKRARDARDSPFDTEISTPGLDEDPSPAAVTKLPDDASSSSYTPDNTALHLDFDLSVDIIGHASECGQESVDSLSNGFLSGAFQPPQLKTASSWSLHDVPGTGIGLGGQREEFSSKTDFYDTFSGGPTPHSFFLSGQPPLPTSGAGSEDTRDWTTRAALLNVALDQHHNRIDALADTLANALSSSHDLYRPQSTTTTLPIDRWFALALELSNLIRELSRAPSAAGHYSAQDCVQSSASSTRTIPSEPQQRFGGGMSRQRRDSDRANNLMLISSFTRLSSAFSRTLECLQLVLEHDSGMQSTTAMSLYPSLQLGDCVFGPMSTTLQAIMVIEGATSLLERLSASFHTHLRCSYRQENGTASAGDNPGSGGTSSQPGMDDVVISLLRLLQAEQNYIMDRVRNLRGILSDGWLPTAVPPMTAPEPRSPDSRL